MGIIGLDYTVIHHDLDRMKLSNDKYDQAMSDVRTMECAARLAMKGSND